MTHTLNTLHEFMVRTEGITYILIVVALVGFVVFWRFLTGRDEDGQRLGADRPGGHPH